MQHPKAYAWNLVGRFLPAGIHLVTNIVLARFLSPADFGMISILTVFFTVANVLMDVGLGGALIKENETRKIDCSTMFVFNLSASTIIYILLFFSADYVEKFFAVNGLAMVMRILCLIFVINAWGLVPRTLMIKQLKFKELTILAIIGSSCACITSIILAINGVKVYSLATYQLVIAGVNVLGAYCYTKYRISFRFSSGSFHRLFSFGIMTTITSIIDTIYENLMSVLFGKYISVSKAGYLDQSKKLENSITQTLTSTINNVSFPILTRMTDDIRKFISEADSIFNTVTKALFPLLVLVCVYSKEIITLLYGENWVEAAPYLSLLIFAGLFQVMETLNRNFIKSLGEVQKLATITIVKRVIGIGLILAWLTFSVDTMLYAYIISSFIGYVCNMAVYSKIISQPMSKQLWQAFIAIIPTASIYVILYLIYGASINHVLKLVISALIMFSYYLFVLPYIGLDIIKYLTKRLK